MEEDCTMPPLAAFLNDATWRSLGEELELSIREMEVLRCVLSDEKEVTIARRLRISPHTVHTHMERLHAKLGARTRVQLVLSVVGKFLSLTSEPDSSLRSICGNRTAGRCPLCS
jgi:DNA-binding CsgD family transcriptional regulator